MAMAWRSDRPCPICPQTQAICQQVRSIGQYRRAVLIVVGSEQMPVMANPG
jgi:hypothetical protein